MRKIIDREWFHSLPAPMQAAVETWLNEQGCDLAHTKEIELTADRGCTVVTYRLNAEGKRYFTETREVALDHRHFDHRPPGAPA